MYYVINLIKFGEKTPFEKYAYQTMPIIPRIDESITVNETNYTVIDIKIHIDKFTVDCIVYEKEKTFSILEGKNILKNNNHNKENMEFMIKYSSLINYAMKIIKKAYKHTNCCIIFLDEMIAHFGDDKAKKAMKKFTSKEFSDYMKNLGYIWEHRPEANGNGTYSPERIYIEW